MDPLHDSTDRSTNRATDRAQPATARSAGSPAATPLIAGSPAAGGVSRAIGLGLIGVLIGVLAFLVLAIPFAFSAGLLVVPVFMARLVGLFVRQGAGDQLSSAARSLCAIVLVLGGVAVANVLVWAWAGHEGGVLSLPDFLNETYGLALVALQFILGTLSAWWSAR